MDAHSWIESIRRVELSRGALALLCRSESAISATIYAISSAIHHAVDDGEVCETLLDAMGPMMYSSLRLHLFDDGEVCERYNAGTHRLLTRIRASLIAAMEVVVQNLVRSFILVALALVRAVRRQARVIPHGLLTPRRWTASGCVRPNHRHEQRRSRDGVRRCDLVGDMGDDYSKRGTLHWQAETARDPVLDG